MRALIYLLAAFLCSHAALAEPIRIKSSAIDLNPENPAEKIVGKLRFLSGIELTSDNNNFGGLSGMTFSTDGNQLTAVTDQGYRLVADMERASNGGVIGFGTADLALIGNRKGEPLKDSKSHRDAEGLSRRGNGDLCVSFERQHRVYCYAKGPDPLIGKARKIKLPNEIHNASANGGLEAITELSDGRLLLLTEKYQDDQGNFIGWTIGDGGIVKLTYKAVNVLRPVDLATLPDGNLLILERHFSPLAGVTNRLGWIAGDSVKAGAILESRELLLLRQPYAVDNYEALAIWRTEGRTIVHIMSDDNFNPLQRTLLLSFEILE